MSDLISRQSAIQAAECIVDHHAITPYQTMRSAMDHLQRILRGMPSTQPERIRGRWEIYVISMLDGEGCRCSECGFEGVPYWDFCPNCGADMREQEGKA